MDMCVFFYWYYSMPHYTVILYALHNLIFSFTIIFNNNETIVEIIYNINNKILMSKAHN